MRVKSILLSIVVGLFSSALAQVAPNINSGNPNFPFPQFLPYEADGGHSLGNLATQNAEGVVHAEMEKRIREAWRIFTNSFTYDGTTYAGVQYVRSNIGCPYDCSEGVGYAMIGAAYMADQTIFNGIWFREHDIRFVLRPQYRNCATIVRPGYGYGANTIAEPGGDAATDGDVDIAFGLLMAYKQWGEFARNAAGNVINDACGNPISYKEAALDVIRGLVERENQGLDPNRFDCRSVSGNVGFDGYFKNGNTWGELTRWASPNYPLDANWCPEFPGNQQLHIDYVAPAYFNCFANFLKGEGRTSGEDVDWNIPQLLRAEASSDWLVGKHYQNSPTSVLSAGWVSLDAANNATFSRFNEGEDFRFAMRTALNPMWNGNPSTSWNPTTHQVVAGGNTFERDMAIRHARLLRDPGAAPWSNACLDPGGGPALTYSGVSQVTDFNTQGGRTWDFPINWALGTGSASSVVAQDYYLMGKIYHQCSIEWDVTDAGDGYLTSVPFYFHGFFRWLGLMTVSGNYLSPCNAQLESNMKVYKKVDKTFAFTNDLVTYTIDYRNYASINAQGVTIIDKIPEGLEFVSATGGGVHSNGTVTWNIGAVPGFKTATGINPTVGSVQLVCRILPKFSGRICNQAEITTTNGKGWKSNEYPNNVTAVMERNCVDVIEKALEIEKSVNYSKVNPGDKVTYTIDFENASKGGFINGGRPGVNVAYGHSGTVANTAQHQFMLRLFHGAAEPYIDYGNYRISYFINDNQFNCINGQAGCTNGWSLTNDIYEGGDRTQVKVSSEVITPGSDARGAWNQRVIVQFGPQLATSTPHISRYFGITGRRVHEGGAEPFRAKWRLYPASYAAVQWSDDWSWNPAAQDADDGLLYPVTNDWTDINNPNIPVTVWHNEACQKPTKFVDNVLVEEWDGYTWRRVLGNGPLPGRDVENVVLTDVLPVGFTFNGFLDANGVNVGNTISVLGETATYNAGTRTITWTKSKLQVKQKGQIRYSATAGFSSGSCNRADELRINTASISATNEGAVTDTAGVIVTCEEVILPPEPSSMTKTADKTSYAVGDQITYTLSYTNTDGTLVADGTSFPVNWTAQNGTAMNVSGGTLKSITNDAGVSTYNYSHGTDGTIEANITFAGSASFGIAFRHSGGAKANGQYVVFNPNPGAGTVVVRAYNGTTQIATTNLGFSANPSNIKIELDGSKMNLWIGNTSNPTPTWTVTGFTIKAGYAGVINGWADNGGDSYGVHTVNTFSTHLDSGFEIQMTDPKPSDITFVSASNSGTNTAGVITFPTVSGPVLDGQVITRSWVGTVASCPASGKIVNNAYTNILGFPTNSIASQAVVSCLGANVCVPPTTVSVSATKSSLCVGEPLTITGAVSPANSNYYYTWYKKGAVPGTASKTYASYSKASVSVTDTGTYILRVEDGNARLASCYKENSVAIKVTPVPSIGDTSISICSGASFKIKPSSNLIDSVPAGTKYIWNIPSGSGFTGGSARTVADSTISDTLTNSGNSAVIAVYTVTPINGSCSGTSFKVSVTINPVPAINNMVVNTCSGIGFNVLPVHSVDGVVPASTTYTWNTPTVSGTSAGKSNTTGATSLSDTLTTTSDVSGSAVYTITPRTGVCQGLDFKVTVTVNPEAKINDFRDTVCSGERISFSPLNLVNGVVPTGTLYTWALPSGIGFTGASGQSTAQGNIADTLYNTGVSPVTATYTVTPTSGSCKGKSFNFVVQVNPNISPKVVISTPATTVCTGSLVKITSVVTDAGTSPQYQWRKNGAALVGETGNSYTTNTPADQDEYILEVTSSETCASPKVVSDTIKIVVTTEVKPAVSILASQDSVCEGSTVTFKANPGNGGTAPTFEWFVNNQSQGAASTKDSIVLNTLQNLDEVKVAMVSNSGCANPKNADTVYTVHVKTKVTPSVSLSVDTTSICAGQKVVLTALGVNGGIAPQYIWMKGSTVLDTTSANVYTDSLNTSQSVSVTLLSNASCVTSATVASSPINISVIPIPKPSVTISGMPAAVCSGQQVTFTATPIDEGGAPKYQWYINGVLQPDADSLVFNTVGLQSSSDEVWVSLQSNAVCAPSGTVLSSKVKTTIQQGIGAGKVGNDQEICYNSTPANLTELEVPKNVSSSNLIYSWETSTNNQLWTMDSQTSKGYDFGANTYTDTIYFRRTVKDPGTSGACNTATSASVKIIVYAQLKGGAISRSQEICDGSKMLTLQDSMSVTGGNGLSYNYEWEQADNSGGVYSPVVLGGDKATYSNNVGMLSTTYYRRKVSSSDATGKSCGTAYSNEVVIRVNPNKDIVVTLDSMVSCEGKPAEYTATIVANGGSSPIYKWYYDGVLQNSTTNKFISSNLVDGKTVSVVVTSNEKCFSAGGNKDSVSRIANIVSSFVPEVSVLPPAAICEGQTVTLAIGKYPSSSNNTYTWYLNGNTVLQTTTVSGVASDSYTGTFNNGDQVSVKVNMDANDPLAQCATTLEGNSAGITLTVYTLPTPNINEGDDTLCEGEQKTYSLSNSKGSLLWFKDGVLLNGKTDSLLTVTEKGTYHAVETRPGGLCPVSSNKVTLKVIAAPQAYAGVDQYVLNGTLVTLHGSGGGYYSWSPSVGLSDSTISKPTFLAQQTTTFMLTVNDSTRTCSAKDEVVIYVERPIVVVNTFSPNGDGVNDYWEIKNIDSFPLCLVKIYNRWGNLVWKSHGYASPWDGTNIYNGQVLPDGTYFYIIELNSHIFKDPLQGWVQIVK